MTVRRLRAKQRCHRCDHCDARATWRGVYFTRFACEDHFGLLDAEDKGQSARDAYQTEAEWSLGI